MPLIFISYSQENVPYEIKNVRTTALPDDTAADFFTGIAGGLCGKIVGVRMDDHRAPEDVRNFKGFVIKNDVGIALVPHQWRHIAGVHGMGRTGGIIVSAGLVEGQTAVAVFVDMKSVKIYGTGGGDVGETENFGFHQNTAVAGRIKFYRAGKPGMRLIPADPGDGIRGVSLQDTDKILCWCDI